LSINALRRSQSPYGMLVKQIKNSIWDASRAFAIHKTFRQTTTSGFTPPYFIAANRIKEHLCLMPPMDAFWLSKHADLKLTATPVLYHCEPIWSWRADALPDFAIWGILEGSGRLTQNNESHMLKPGYCFLFSPQDRIEAEQDPLDPLSLFVARFEILDTDGESIPNHQLELQNNPIQTSNPASLEAIAKASTLIDSDLGRKWTLEELGESSGLSPSQFSRLFSKQYGEPPIRSLINRRMKEAKRLVLETSLSLQEISTKLGYENQSFFERQFLKRVGFAPEALRRSRAILRKFHLRI
ncbi:MAG: helix-turn-helix transcriptional regulator, partial [Verrucomicrobiia bacterium]